MGDPIISQVFALPELVSLIVHHVHAATDTTVRQRAAMLKLTRATSFFVDPALEQLWRWHADIKQIAQQPLEYRQRYATKIRVLRLGSPSSFDRYFQDLNVTFDNLEHLVFGQQDLDGDFSVCREDVVAVPTKIWAPVLLRPKLRALSLFWTCLINEDTFSCIERMGSHLRYLHIYIPEQDWSMKQPLRLLIRLLRGLPRLEILKIASMSFDGLQRPGSWANDGDVDLYGSLIEALAGLFELRELSFLNEVNSPHELPEFSVVHHSPEMPLFPRLDSLTGDMSYATLHTLSTMMPCLTKLNLSVPGQFDSCSDDMSIAYLIKLPRLQSLDLFFHETNEPLPLAELEALTHLSQLRRLAIGTRWYTEDGNEVCRENPPCLVAPDLTDSIFSSIVRTCTVLQELELDLDHCVTTEGLVDLGMRCRDLRSLVLPGDFDLLDLDATPSSSPVLFPRLTKLDLGLRCSDLRDQYAELVVVMQRAVPRLSMEPFHDEKLAARLDAAIRADPDVTFVLRSEYEADECF